VERAPRTRRASLSADALIVVRRDDLTKGSSLVQAEESRRRYPYWERWGISGFYARNDSDVYDLDGDQLERFPVLCLYRPAVWDAAGFEIVPTLTEEVGDMATAVDVDLRIGLKHDGRDGLPWTFLNQAPDPSRIIPGRHIVVGSGAAVAVAVVVDITETPSFMCSPTGAR